MAKSSFVRLKADELALIGEVRKAETFRKTAWADYGRAWDQHLPQIVNAFCHVYFGTVLFPWHLAVYYCPCSEITIVGGRGSAKTEGLALAWGILCALHPGEDHMHVAPSKDQAERTIRSILKWGVNGFTDTFIDSVVFQPFPEIRFKKWDDDDPGGKLLVRSVGDENVELLRSHTVARISWDEAFRSIETASTAAQLRGCIRGINQYKLKQLDPSLQTRYQGMLRGISLAPMAKRPVLQEELNQFVRQYDLAYDGRMILYGNAGEWDWSWERMDRAEIDPQHYYSIHVSSYDNPTFTKEQLADLERSFGDDAELRQVEMEGKRPMNLGDQFPSYLIDSCTDPEALGEAAQGMEKGLLGYLVARHAQYGVYEYRRPPRSDSSGPHMHVLGCDPGTGLLPGRNKWVIVVFDVSEVPCRLVHFRMGYLGRDGTGHYHGFFAALKEAVLMYPTANDDIVVESTGPQKGMTELSWPEDLPVNAVDFTSLKPLLLNYLRQLMGSSKLTWPRIERLRQELGNYRLPDTDTSQDIVMALICACLRIWAYHGFKLSVQPQGQFKPTPPTRHARMRGTRPNPNGLSYLP